MRPRRTHFRDLELFLYVTQCPFHYLMPSIVPLDLVMKKLELEVLTAKI